MSTHQIVIIGASFAGLYAAHGLLKDVLPTIPNQAFKITQIAPNDGFFWKIGAPRIIVNPNSLPIEKALIPIVPKFAKYSKEQYQFVKAFATSIDPATKTVQIDAAPGSIHYDTLLITSGTTLASPIWSVSKGDDATVAALKELHAKIPSAQSILIAGGGAAGVETAGELGELYGKTKEITILSGTTSLLNRLNNKNVGKDAQARLQKMGVKVINDSVRVTSHITENGKEVLRLSNGETKIVDVYIEATGDKPNSSFVPAEWLDSRHQIKTDPNTLRLDVPGVTGVYVYGSVGSYSDGGLMDIMFAKPALLETLRLDLSGKAPGPRTSKIYKKATSDFQFVPIGSTQGVGIAFGWKLPSFIIKMAKSRDFMIGNALKTVEGTA